MPDSNVPLGDNSSTSPPESPREDTSRDTNSPSSVTPEGVTDEDTEDTGKKTKEKVQLPTNWYIVKHEDKAKESKEEKERKSEKKAGKPQEDRLTLIKVPPKILDKIEKVFVAPLDYDKQLRQLQQKISSQRIYLVYGQENSGRFTCALQLGMDLYKNLYDPDKTPTIQFHVNTPSNAKSPLNFAQPNFDEDTVYIIQNIFEGGFSYHLLSDEHLSPVNRILNDAKALLILTATDKDSGLDQPNIEKIETGSWDLLRVLTNHLNYYGEQYGPKEVSEKVVAAAKEDCSNLFSRFRTPIQIDQFCYQLSSVASASDDKDALKKAIDELAEKIVQRDRNIVRQWFKQLTVNQQLYAMLVALCPHLEWRLFYGIYEKAVQTLRNQGLLLQDPREFGLDDMLTVIHAQIEIDNTITFNSNAFRQEVWRQVDNYHHLLWSLMETFCQWIGAYTAPEYWESRRILGEAIGTLVLAHPEKLQVILEQLARSGYGGVASVPGYALGAVCRISVDYHAGEHLAFVAELIENWTKSADPDLMWAAGAAIWRIYNTLNQLAQLVNAGHTETVRKVVQTLERIRKALTQLADDFDTFSLQAQRTAWEIALGERWVSTDDKSLDHLPEVFPDVVKAVRRQLRDWATDNSNTIVYAIRQIAFSYPEEVVTLLRGWLRQEPQQEYEVKRYWLAQNAIFDLFRANERPMEQRQGPLLALIELLLPTAEEVVGANKALVEINEELVDRVLFTLLNWISSPDWHDRIQMALLKTINRTTDRGRTQLCRSLLHYWMDSDNDAARRITHTLITRAKVLQGMPVALSSKLGGVVVLDASAWVPDNCMADKVGHALYYCLDGLIPVAVAHLGQSRIALEPGKWPTCETLQAEYPAPSLLQPLLENLPLTELHFILALTWGPIIDLMDVKPDTASTPQEHPYPIIVATIGQATAVSPPFTVVQLEPALSERDLARLESAVIKQLTRSLAWRCQNYSQTLYLSLEHTAEELEESLEKWVDQIDDVNSLKVATDPACLIADALLRLAAADPTQAVNRLSRWLQDDAGQDSLRRLIGIAGCKMVLRIWAEYTVPPPVSSHSVIFQLAPLLAAHGDWPAIAALLVTVRRWLNNNSWAEHCHDSEGGFNNLAEMLGALKQLDHSKLRDTLRAWKQPLVGEKVVPEAAVRLAERLEVRLALGSPDDIPALGPGERYGVIIWVSSSQTETTELVGKLWEFIHAGKGGTLRWLLYRAGQSRPIAVGKDFSAEALNASDLRPTVPLLAPLLESLPCDQVGIVLLLAEQDILDRADWMNNWKTLFKLYSRNEKAAWATHFQPIPYQSDPDLKRVAQQILETVL